MQTRSLEKDNHQICNGPLLATLGVLNSYSKAFEVQREKMHYQLKILHPNFQSETKASHFQTFKKLKNLSPAYILAKTTTHDYIPVKKELKKKRLGIQITDLTQECNVK